MIVVFGNHVVSAFFFRKRELALSVGYPQTELVAAQRTEHHTVVLGNGQTDEFALELMRVVVQHLSAFGTCETELNHQLTTVTDTQ